LRTVGIVIAQQNPHLTSINEPITTLPIISTTTFYIQINLLTRLHIQLKNSIFKKIKSHTQSPTTPKHQNHDAKELNKTPHYPQRHLPTLNQKSKAHSPSESCPPSIEQNQG